MRLDAFIADLLYDHDCVIIPGFGGLVATYRPARLNRITHVIRPPSKHVGFNRNLTHNDGLLIAQVSRLMRISYRDAQSGIEEEVARMQHLLNTGERVIWDRIGLFFRDRSGSLQFIPEEQENFLLESYGLPPIQLRPVAREEAGATPIAVPDVPAVAATGSRSFVWWRVAAVAAMPLALAAGWLLSRSIHHSHEYQFAGLDLFGKPRAAAFVPSFTRPAFAQWDTAEAPQWKEWIAREGSRINFLTGEEDAMGIEIGRPVPAERPAPARMKQRSGYLVVAGAFGLPENAETFIRQLAADGLPAFRAGRKGRLHLVALGSYASEREARAAMGELRARGRRSVWLYRKAGS